MRIEKRVSQILKGIGAGAMPETQGRAERVFAELTEAEKKRLRGLGLFDQPNELTQMFGNESEKHGAQFGLFPLWVGIVQEMLEEA